MHGSAFHDPAFHRHPHYLVPLFTWLRCNLGTIEAFTFHPYTQASEYLSGLELFWLVVRESIQNSLEKRRVSWSYQSSSRKQTPGRARVQLGLQDSRNESRLLLGFTLAFLLLSMYWFSPHDKKESQASYPMVPRKLLFPLIRVQKIPREGSDLA